MKGLSCSSLLCIWTLLLAACVGSTTVSPQSITLPQLKAPSYLRGFSIIGTAEEPAVGRILRYDGALIGSAVLISPSCVLTAAHVVDGGDSYWFETNGQRYCIDAVRMHPIYKIGNIVIHDIAIGILYTPCKETPVAFGSYPLIRGEPLTAVGHGGGFRKRSNPGTFWYYGTLMEDPFNIKMLCYEGTVWFGDSGGAVLDFEGKLVGIISSMSGSRYIHENSSVRLDLVMPWINSVMEECNE